MLFRYLLFVFFVVVHGKTVRYSNVPPRASVTRKTYDLEVPGSAPIRIIEAEPIWSNDDVPSTTPSYLDGLEHRSTKYKTGKEYFTTETTKTTLGQPVTQMPDHSADALNTFLKDYADKVKADRKKYDEEDSTEGLSEAEPENNRPKSWGLVSTKLHNHPFEDKKGWVTLEAVPWSSSKISKWQSSHKNGPKPWETNSNRPVSSWSSRPGQDLEYDTSNDDNYNKYSNNHNNNKPTSVNSFNNQDSNFNGYNSNDPSYNYNKNSNKPSFNNPGIGFLGYNDNNDKNTYDNSESSFITNKNHFGNQNTNKFASNNNVFGNNKFNANTPNDNQYNPNDNIFFDKPYATYDVHIRPSTQFPPNQNAPETSTVPKPMYGYDQRPLQVKPAWPQEIPSRPAWNKPPPTIFSNKPLPDPWFDRKPVHQAGDIITDGRPGDFPAKPAPYPTYEPQGNRPVNSLHPSTHPDNGNGEWVLVSTTKGYQYPRSKHQRSIEVTPDSIGTRRGIRLTVLPPDRDSAVNMTTSHGGMLEVESTFHSVEESHKLFSERLKAGNKTRVTSNKTGKKPVRQVTKLPRPQKRPGKPVPVMHHKRQDATAVLAAVGAGMVPATMAMLVPFVTGRRRRRRRNIAAGELIDTVPKVIGYASSKASRI